MNGVSSIQAGDVCMIGSPGLRYLRWVRIIGPADQGRWLVELCDDPHTGAGHARVQVGASYVSILPAQEYDTKWGRNRSTKPSGNQLTVAFDELVCTADEALRAREKTVGREVLDPFIPFASLDDAAHAAHVAADAASRGISPAAAALGDS